MPRKPKPSVEPEAQQAASNAAAEQSPQEPAPPAELAQQQPQAASCPDSNAAPTHQQPEPQSQQDAKTSTSTADTDAGNVPAATASSDTNLTALRTGVRDRLQKLPEWPRILATVREMRADSKLASMKTEARERFIWGEMDRLYPATSVQALNTSLPEPKATQVVAATPLTDSGRINGLGDLPPNWPELPGNASLAAEVGWVQAERLRIVEEKPGSATVVTLSKARSPAPSWSALSWLETSIRSYAKFVEVAAKASGGGDEEGEQVKRERLAIEEIRGLLAEMAGNPTGPGR